MADQPNNDIEKILRAYSEARRKRADLPLHPATRKMLHGEVARHYGRKDAGRSWGRLRAFWPQLAFGSGLCAILIVAVLSLRQPAQRKELSAPAGPATRGEELSDKPTLQQSAQPEKRYMRESLARVQQGSPQNTDASPAGAAADLRFGREPAPAASAPAADALAPAKAGDAQERKVLRDTALPKLAVPEAAVKEQEQTLALKDSLAERGVNPPADANSQFGFGGGAVSANRALRSAAPPNVELKSEVLSSATKLAAAGEITNLGAALRTKFVELPTDQNASVGVLNSFQVEQQGDDLRIVDRDGSVYYGNLSVQLPGQQPATLTQQVSLSYGAAPSQNAAAGGLGLNESSPNTAVYFLRAQGTNVTLAKPVTLEGRFLERTNVALFGETRAKKEANLEAKPAAAPPVDRFSKARKAIVGRATVGQTNQFPVNAVAVEPGN
jgi:hypothetical protein